MPRPAQLLALAALAFWSMHALMADEPAATDAGPAALFDKLDANQDGQLAPDEIPDEQKLLFERLVGKSDSNQDGQLSKPEFTAALEDTRPERDEGGAQPGAATQPAAIEPEAMFAQLDANQDGKIVLDEVPEQGRDRFQQILGRADKDADGALSKEEFITAARAIARQVVPQGAAGGAFNRQELLRRIKQVDADGDGKLSREEAPEQMKPLFDRIDANQDGFLEVRELAQHLQAMSQKLNDGLKNRFRQLDADGDGKLSESEAPRRMKRNFKTFDTNQDGFLDEAEMRQSFRPKNKPAEKQPDNA